MTATNDHPPVDAAAMLRAAHAIARLTYPRTGIDAPHIAKAVRQLGNLIAYIPSGARLEAILTDIVSGSSDVLDKPYDLTDDQLRCRYALRAALRVGTAVGPDDHDGMAERYMERRLRDALDELNDLDEPLAALDAEDFGVGPDDWTLLITLVTDGLPYRQAVQATHLLTDRG